MVNILIAEDDTQTHTESDNNVSSCSLTDLCTSNSDYLCNKAADDVANNFPINKKLDELKVSHAKLMKQDLLELTLIKEEQVKTKLIQQNQVEATIMKKNEMDVDVMEFLNTLSYRINAAFPNKFDGLLAMQYVELGIASLNPLITGEKQTLQILATKKHCVVAEHVNSTIQIFDPLAVTTSDAEDLLNGGLAQQVYALFKPFLTSDKMLVTYKIGRDQLAHIDSSIMIAAYLLCRTFARDPRFFDFQIEPALTVLDCLLNNGHETPKKFYDACAKFTQLKKCGSNDSALEVIYEIQPCNVDGLYSVTHVNSVIDAVQNEKLPFDSLHYNDKDDCVMLDETRKDIDVVFPTDIDAVTVESEDSVCDAPGNCPSRAKRHVGRLELAYGQQLPDDLINLYCEKLNKALKNKFEGMMAMQFITLESKNLENYFTGRKPVLQILLDVTRAHYLMVERLEGDEHIYVYDSLTRSKASAKRALNRGIADQIFSMFGHISTDNEVIISYDLKCMKQGDGWSCGYYCLAYLTCRAFDCNPQRYDFNIEDIYKYFCKVLDNEKPTAKDFRHGLKRFRRERLIDNNNNEEAVFHITPKDENHLRIDNVTFESNDFDPKHKNKCKKEKKKDSKKHPLWLEPEEEEAETRRQAANDAMNSSQNKVIVRSAESPDEALFQRSTAHIRVFDNINDNNDNCRDLISFDDIDDNNCPDLITFDDDSDLLNAHPLQNNNQQLFKDQGHDWHRYR